MKKWESKLSLNDLIMLRPVFIITLLFAIPAGILTTGKCLAQTLVYYGVKESNKVYALHPDSSFKETSIFFPNYDEWHELSKGYEVRVPAVITLAATGATDSGSIPFLYARVYSKNVRKITFRIGNSDE